jgi:hypothetical protein
MSVAHDRGFGSRCTIAARGVTRSLVAVVVLATALAASATPASADDPLPAPGPFTTAFSLERLPGHDHKVRIKRMLINIIGGPVGGGTAGEAEYYFNGYCEYSTPCGKYGANAGTPLLSPTQRLILHVHEFALVGEHNEMVILAERFAYVRRAGRVVFVSSKRLKFYRFHTASEDGRLRLRLGLVREECVTQPVPSPVPAGVEVLYPQSGYAHVPCPSRWQSGHGLLRCVRQLPQNCAPLGERPSTITLGFAGPDAAGYQTPECGGESCTVVGRTAALQLSAGILSQVFEVPSAGYLTAWSITLGQPGPGAVAFFNKEFGEPAEAAILVLRAEQGGGSRYLVESASEPVDLAPYFGSVANWTLTPAAQVAAGDFIALSIPTWAPALAVTPEDGSDDSQNEWLGTWPSNACTDHTLADIAPSNVGESAFFGCLYSGARLEYSATLTAR